MCNSVYRRGCPETPWDQAGRPPTPGWPPQDLAGRTPPDQADPLGPGRENPPLRPGRQTPQEEDSSIWSMSNWYASYWNAFLFIFTWVFSMALRNCCRHCNLPPEKLYLDILLFDSVGITCSYILKSKTKATENKFITLRVF